MKKADQKIEEQKVDVKKVSGVKVSISFCLPVDNNLTNGYCLQNIIDNVLNYAVKQHLKDAIHWMALNKEIANEHEKWASVIQRGIRTLTIEQTEVINEK